MSRADFLVWKKEVLSLEFFREQNLDSGAWRIDCLTGRIGAGRWGQSCREGEVWTANDASNSLLVLFSVFYPLRPPPHPQQMTSPFYQISDAFSHYVSPKPSLCLFNCP